ncbi:hypothetical protein [Halosimplex amylolyticum]|uniref:hypothetical protein n=1 Tax=Halosimplex amylolyticum TaxID=3396616 RepID=UPI003F55546D
MSEHTRSKTTSDRLNVDRPVRAADQNRTLASDTDPAGEDFFLPSLEAGLTLLDVTGARGVPVLQSLVLDHLLLHDGPAFWVDADGHATTTSLAQLAPSQRLLDRVHVARGFTAYQHYGALCDLPAAVNRHIQATTSIDPFATPTRNEDHSPADADAPAQTPSLVVAPAFDAQYRADDTLGDAHARTLQARGLARLREYATGYDVPVLLTRTTADEFTAPIETIADRHLECEQTKLGPRFVDGEFETFVYPVGDGAYYQTTFAYWRQLLDARASAVGLAPAGPAQPDTDDAVGQGVTVDGAAQSLTADPLLDAWTGPVGAGGR